MKPKHLRVWFDLARSVSSLSPCGRAKHGCILINYERNTVVATGYNGTPRGSPHPLCGYPGCDRDAFGIKSGERIEVGCIHAEQNAICNAAAEGAATLGLRAIITGEPCLMCAKLLFQAGIKHVYVLSGGYTTQEGVVFLESNGVTVEPIEVR